MAGRETDRMPTAGERALLAEVFGGALDADAVRVRARRFMPFQAASVAMSPNGHMYFPPLLYCGDFAAAALPAKALFVHEAVHVWQKQLGYPVLWCGLCLAFQGGYWRSRAYRYRHLAGTGLHFSRLNMEQQAAAVEDYFRLIWQGQRPDAGLAELVAPFLRRPWDRRLLPRSMRLR